MKIQINKYDSEVYKFVKAYLKANEEEWLYTPHHRLVSEDFYRNLKNGDLDNIEYDIKYDPLVFDAEKCLITFRYYNNHKDMHKHYDKYANICRIYTELGQQGNIFKSQKNIGKKGGRKSYRKSK